jgi:hypothetical protein
VPRRPLRTGLGAPWPDSPARRAWARRVYAAVEEYAAEVRTLGIMATISVNWVSDHSALVIRCSILKSGLPDPEERERASFVGGYLAGRLMKFKPSLWYAGRGQSLILHPLEEDDFA